MISSKILLKNVLNLNSLQIKMLANSDDNIRFFQEAEERRIKKDKFQNF